MIKVLILAGASAVGKTTVAHTLIESGEFELVRSVTTREMRADSFGAEYIYVSRDEFNSLIASRGVLEYTEYSGNLYGTPRSEIERISGEGKIPLLILDLNGVRSLASADGVSPCSVYLYDSLDVMERRLYDRYLGEEPSADGLSKYVSRVEQNISDYIMMEEYAPYFFTFVKGKSTPRESADAIYKAFSEFCDGTPKDETCNALVAKSLFIEAYEKKK